MMEVCGRVPLNTLGICTSDYRTGAAEFHSEVAQDEFELLQILYYSPDDAQLGQIGETGEIKVGNDISKSEKS